MDNEERLGRDSGDQGISGDDLGRDKNHNGESDCWADRQDIEGQCISIEDESN